MGDADILAFIHGVGKGRSQNLLEWLERNLPHQAPVFARKFGVPVDGTFVPQLVKPRGGNDGCRAEAGVKQEWSQKLHGDNTLLHVSGLSPGLAKTGAASLWCPASRGLLQGRSEKSRC